MDGKLPVLEGVLPLVSVKMFVILQLQWLALYTTYFWSIKFFLCMKGLLLSWSMKLFLCMKGFRFPSIYLCRCPKGFRFCPMKTCLCIKGDRLRISSCSGKIATKSKFQMDICIIIQSILLRCIIENKLNG